MYMERSAQKQMVILRELREAGESVRVYKQKKGIRMTTRQVEIIQILSQKKEWTIGEIASTLGVSSAAATKNVDRLERRGMVLRKKDLMDRRVMNVCLTFTAMQLLQQEMSLERGL